MKIFLGDTLISVKLPYEHNEHINLKIITVAGESNKVIFIAKYRNSLGESVIKELKLPEQGFYKNELSWDNNVATIDLGKIDDFTGSVKITFSDLENNSISKVVIDCAQANRYNLHYEYEGSDFGGWVEGIYLIRDNPYLTNNIVQNKFGYSYNETNIQPNSISGTITYYDSAAGEYREAAFNELDLLAEGYHYNSLYLELMHLK